MSLGCAACPADVDFDSVSGSLTLTLPAGSQYTLAFDSVSGRIITTNFTPGTAAPAPSPPKPSPVTWRSATPKSDPPGADSPYQGKCPEGTKGVGMLARTPERLYQICIEKPKPQI